jgi:hypothetical protein
MRHKTFDFSKFRRVPLLQTMWFQIVNIPALAEKIVVKYYIYFHCKKYPTIQELHLHL